MANYQRFRLTILLIALYPASFAQACDKADSANRLTAITDAGAFSITEQRGMRSIVYLPARGGRSSVVRRDTVPDYTESSLFRVDGNLVVLEDHAFELYDEEPPFAWWFLSPQGELGHIDAQERPKLTRVQGGWVVTSVPVEGREAVHTICDGQPLLAGNVDCADNRSRD